MFPKAKAGFGALMLCALLLGGCANPQNIDPIAGRTFIVEDRSRQMIWDAALAALQADGEVESADFERGEIRGYAGEGAQTAAVLIAMSQLYPDEDTYTISVAGDSVAPLGDPQPAQDELVRGIRENLQL